MADVLAVEDFVPATFTPMKDNGDVNIDAIDEYQRFLKDKGVNYVYINGSTGEGTSLTQQERKRITEKWAELASMKGREMTVMVQVGGTSFRDTVDLTQHAVASGAHVISALAPLYFSPVTVDDLVEYCSRVAKEASGLPFYYYHIPERTGVRLNMEEFLIKAKDRIPNLRGIKFSSKDLYEGARCLRTKDAKGHHFDILFGCDEQVIAAFAMGFKGAIGSTYSLIPGVYRRAKQALEQGRLAEARDLQVKSVQLVDICFKYGKGVGGPVPAFKAALQALGVPVGPARFPMASLDKKMTGDLLAELQDAGFFEWAKE